MESSVFKALVYPGVVSSRWGVTWPWQDQGHVQMGGTGLEPVTSRV